MHKPAETLCVEFEQTMTMNSEQVKSLGLSRRRMSVVLLGLNMVGAAVYLARTSPSWAIPEEHGMVPITGEPFVWFFGAFPICAGFFLLNLIWGGFIVINRQWRSGVYWLLILPCWLAAIVIDFAHH
jgi:TRAP-type C4-dicarboxylate transport system permease small subunit